MLFGWSTPEILSRSNEQNETTLHNIYSLKPVLYTSFYLVSALALAGAVLRAFLHCQGRVTTADFVLPSLVLSPALLMIFTWIQAGLAFPGNVFRTVLIYVDQGPMGSEVPEVLMGLCLFLYTYANLKRARALRRHGTMDQ